MQSSLYYTHEIKSSLPLDILIMDWVSGCSIDRFLKTPTDMQYEYFVSY